ncbi:helix-turn-helix domain-containing protein [Pseudooceanicola sp. 216_PA32_1]|uniref:Helix-turn-helix domain-containing protein n=1 Tax=Pseudooceanicola pacificus TaxID=2676438 RepID=A0A844W225_9RHOB|nr:helix-turn-helix domain-containing protein [Pseudooceanicola pacificus]MWB76871.1 helix-turn-helix domain-containing protein [Pseudooceanicola pacificus]
MSYEMTPALSEGVPVSTPGFSAEIPSSVVKSAARTIQILEFFDHIRRDVSISEIANALHYPQSSTSALLRSMVAMGYLQHNRVARTYRLTRRTGLLGAWVDPSLVRQGAIVNLAHGLARDTEETVILARLNDMSVQTIYVAEGGVRPASASVGSQHPVARSAAGMALLAMYEDRQIRRILTRLNSERPRGETAIDVADYMERLSDGRRHGAFAGPGSAPDMGAVAAQLRHDSAGDMLVIAVEGPEQRIMPRADALAKLIRAGLAQLAG